MNVRDCEKMRIGHRRREIDTRSWQIKGIYSFKITVLSLKKIQFTVLLIPIPIAVYFRLSDLIENTVKKKKTDSKR